MEEPASDKLLKASAVTETDAVIIPAKNFIKKSITLIKIPTPPLKVPYFCLTLKSETSALFLTKIFKSSLVIYAPLKNHLII